ncbi:MAG: RAMP superfamily CRISPR-associated protein [Clostridiales bacterium]|jgi:CRISPR/Cas system CSM-associated protein Csm3 (group 7 of RAMP superfamily)|nr:RAMP superfamily CRISPR-associated protein [Clostridiales bacterium]
MNHVYYRLTLTLVSPASIGSGLEENTDCDIALDSRKCPYIPGTALAGLFRALVGNEDDKKKFFGEITPERSVQSPILVYDGKCVNFSKEKISIRDSVALDEHKTAIHNMKFDFEIAETGLVFVAFIEIDKNHDDSFQVAAERLIEGYLLPAVNSGAARLGHKSTRGYGQISVGYQKRSFDLSSAKTLNKWLDFNMFDEKSWKMNIQTPEPFKDDSVEIITIPLKLRGGISIREYSTEAGPEENKEEHMPDYKQLALSDNRPVIPGTSWGGAFSGRMVNMLKHSGYGREYVDDLFGDVKLQTSDAQTSKISFSETILANGVSKEITRNSIDRFSGSTKHGALYTEKAYYMGITTLTIVMPRDLGIVKKLMYACILDLCRGYLAVGGLTSVGRGLFELQEDQEISIGEEKYTLEKLEGLVNESVQSVETQA